MRTDSRAGVASVVVLGALVVAAITGIAANWPHQRRISIPGAGSLPPTELATATAVRAAHCDIPGNHGCERVTVRLASSGETADLDTVDPALHGRVELEDKVRVYRNDLPPDAVGPGGRPLAAYAFSDFQRTRLLLWLALAFVVIA